MIGTTSGLLNPTEKVSGLNGTSSSFGSIFVNDQENTIGSAFIVLAAIKASLFRPSWTMATTSRLGAPLEWLMRHPNRRELGLKRDGRHNLWLFEPDQKISGFNGTFSSFGSIFVNYQEYITNRQCLDHLGSN